MFARNLLAGAIIAIGAFSSTVSSAVAHHGWSGQENKVTELTGIVVEPVSLAGPHGTMKIKVGNDVWDVTLAPSARTRAAGLTSTAIPVGATITVRGNRATAPGKLEMKTILVTHGTKRYNVYPDRD